MLADRRLTRRAACHPFLSLQTTHHLLDVKPDGQPVTVNGKATTATTLTELVQVLRHKQPYWPVPLVKGVRPHVAVRRQSSV